MYFQKHVQQSDDFYIVTEHSVILYIDRNFVSILTPK
jgi:hypothetical protein